VAAEVSHAGEMSRRLFEATIQAEIEEINGISQAIYRHSTKAHKG
jgi:hypothetical protein